MNKHIEFIERNPHMYESPEEMIGYIRKQIEAVQNFHKEKPHRVGVACTIYQKPKGAAYSEALGDMEEAREASLQENNLDDVREKYGQDQAKGEYRG